MPCQSVIIYSRTQMLQNKPDMSPLPAFTRRQSNIAALFFFVLSIGTAFALDKMEQAQNDTGRIVVDSPDLIVANSVLQLTEDTQRALAPVLGLTDKDTSHLTIQALPAEEGKPWPLPLVSAALREDHLDFSLVLRYPGPHLTEEYLRSLTEIFLYQKILASQSRTFHAGEALPPLPIWLSEGTLQLCLQILITREYAGNFSSSRDWDHVVRHALDQHKAPTLDTVMKWSDLSSYTLERLWQQAFSYYLVSSITRPGPPREAFQQWLGKAASQQPTPFASLAPVMSDEFAWRAQLHRSDERSRDIVYSWDETVEELNKALSITIVIPGKNQGITTTIDALKPYKTNLGFIEAVQNKISDLTEIDLRANHFWHPVLGAYRGALMTLANLNPADLPKNLPLTRGSKDFDSQHIALQADYPDYIAYAKRYTEQLLKLHDQVSDYLNWVVVTKSANEQGSQFSSYYELQKKLAEFQPRQKDTITHNVLKIEQQTGN